MFRHNNVTWDFLLKILLGLLFYTWCSWQTDIIIMHAESVYNSDSNNSELWNSYSPNTKNSKGITRISKERNVCGSRELGQRQYFAPNLSSLPILPTNHQYTGPLI